MRILKAAAYKQQKTIKYKTEVVGGVPYIYIYKYIYTHVRILHTYVYVYIIHLTALHTYMFF